MFNGQSPQAQAQAQAQAAQAQMMNSLLSMGPLGLGVIFLHRNFVDY